MPYTRYFIYIYIQLIKISCVPTPVLNPTHRCIHRDFQNIAVNGARAGQHHVHVHTPFSPESLTPSPLTTGVY